MAQAYGEVTTGKQVFAYQMIFADYVNACFLLLAKACLLSVQLTWFASYTRGIKNTHADIYQELAVIKCLIVVPEKWF